MRIEQRKIFTVDELSPQAFKRALQEHIDRQSEGPAWSKEIFDSLASLFRHCNGVELKDYDLGVYVQSRGLTVEFEREEVGDFTGRRAIAWLENNLISSLRMPWTGEKRWELAKRGEAYRPGLVPPCPFTGYCADEDYLDALRKAVNGGATLQDAFEGLADEYRRIHEAEDEYEQSEEYFREYAKGDELEFDENGAEI